MDTKSSKQFHELKCDDEIVEFYSLIEKIDFDWWLKEDIEGINYLDKETDIVGGELNIISLDEMLSGFSAPDKNLLSNFDTYEYLPFDYTVGEYAVCLKKQNDFIENKLYLINLGITEIKPVCLDMGVKEYFNNGIDNYFFFCWQMSLSKSGTKSKLISHYLSLLF